MQSDYRVQSNQKSFKPIEILHHPKLRSRISPPLGLYMNSETRMATLHDIHVDSTPDPAVITALEAIRTTPVESSMYARLYGCYPRPDATAITYDWDTRVPWMSLLEDIRDHHSVRW
ncbi:hypothetical protein BDM02DRAFT_3112570 [Thelephora ganbajun]|uniref:Uncharacterized protein n=1 Tax=Thelephora ganbajun TaxID=370292 RepID=A0ACB6ZL68_THEGA|nr:hypothetical protein BDM02DRAFT_3112570 [Thelephora ganbajun]